MSEYLQPTDLPINFWLFENSTKVDKKLARRNIITHGVCIVIIKNHEKNAALIIYNTEDFDKLHDKDDRKKRYYIADIDKIKEVAKEFEKVPWSKIL